MKGTFKAIGQLALGTISLALIATACKKGSSADPVEPPINIIPKVSPQGQPLEAGLTKQIGAAGGVVTSSDQALTITIPSGALTAKTTIGIQRISNTNIAGKGIAYRLTPHGQQFAKPVTIEYDYAALKDSLAFPLSAGLSFQGDDGIWQLPAGNDVDTALQLVAYNTTHFSDWALMERVSLRPISATLGEGEKLNIEALLYNALPNPCNCPDDLLQPLPPRGNPYPVGEPAPLPSKYIKSWKLTGPGSLSRTTGNKVEYRAPASVNAFTSATVVAELNGPGQGKYLLLSTITLISDSWIELSIGGGAPKIFPASPVVRSGSQYMLANPEDEGGGYFGLKWIGGVGTHGFDLDNKTTFHYNTPGLSYVSMFLPNKDEELKPSGGGVTITHLGDGKVEGTFVVSQAGYGDLTTTTSAKGRFKAKLFN